MAFLSIVKDMTVNLFLFIHFTKKKDSPHQGWEIKFHSKLIITQQWWDYKELFWKAEFKWFDDLLVYKGNGKTLDFLYE